MIDDRSGREKTPEQINAALRDVLAAREKEVFDGHVAATVRFVDMVREAMSNSSAEEVEVDERAFVRIFERLWPGAGEIWVHEVFRRAREIQGA